MGCGHHRRVGTLRRTRRLRLRAGRRVSRRDRRACALAAGGGHRPIRSVARRSIPARALSACADSRWLTRTRWLGRRCFRGRRAPRIRLRGPGRARIHSHQAHAAGSAAVARANARRAHRFERCNLDDRKLGDSPSTCSPAYSSLLRTSDSSSPSAPEGFFWQQCSSRGSESKAALTWRPTTRVAHDRSLRPGFERLRAAQDPAWSWP